MRCDAIDELAAAYALGAVEPDEEREFAAHLESCREPHEEARGLIGAGMLVAASAPPMDPSPALRARLMTTIAATPQEHRPERVAAEEARPRWWQARWMPAAAGAFAVLVLLVLGAWSVRLTQQVAERDAAIQAIAAADAVYQVDGTAGEGLLLADGDEATFLASSLAGLPNGSLYQLWLIGPDGAPIDVGTLTDTDGIAMVDLERALGPATVFAVTLETERVAAPTSDPVLVAAIEG